MNMADAPDQCVVLVGGLGSRLGSLTKICPKPLLPVGGRPFIEELIWDVKRFGFQRLLFLAGYRAERFVEYIRNRPVDNALSIDLVIEPEPLGTGGALSFAYDSLDPRFLLLNGDSLFDFNWLDLITVFDDNRDCQIAMALRTVADSSRYGVVEMTGSRITMFHERGNQDGGTVNGGVYLMSKNAVARRPARCSLERDLLPDLGRKGFVYGTVQQGFFLDIGIPTAYAQAPSLLHARRTRPGVFLDRDGLLNVDHGYVHRIEDFAWLPGAIDAVKMANDAGYFVFLVTNQAGVARGMYTEDDVLHLHRYMQSVLRSHGAHLDDIRYCPFHPEGTVDKYKLQSDWRKPAPGMILDLLKCWPVAITKSFLIGDKESDIEAGHQAGLTAYRFDGGNVAAVLSRILAQRADQACTK